MEISNELRRLVDPNGKCCCEYCLINKCKEWALTMGYFIYSTNELAFIKTLSLETLDVVFSNGAMNESECIFKATQYIYDNLSNV